jgi:hypothetical protein
MNTWLFATLLCLAPADDLVGRAQGVDFGSEEFSAWLLDRVGFSAVEEYMLESLIVRAAEEQGVRPSPEEVSAAFKAERAKVIKDTFRGSEEAYRNDLINRGMDPEAHDLRRRSELEPELCLHRLARAGRVITEKLLRDRYKVLYGDLGEHTSVDVLFYSLYHGIGPAGQRPDLVLQAVKAKARADKGATDLRAGRAVSLLAADSDPIVSNFVQANHVVQWRKNVLGEEAELALSSLDDAGEVSPPIRVWDGYYVLRLNERELVSFEDAREFLLGVVHQDTPTAEEVGAARTAVKDQYQLEILLR